MADYEEGNAASDQSQEQLAIIYSNTTRRTDSNVAEDPILSLFSSQTAPVQSFSDSSPPLSDWDLSCLQDIPNPSPDLFANDLTVNSNEQLSFAEILSSPSSAIGAPLWNISPIGSGSSYNTDFPSADTTEPSCRGFGLNSVSPILGLSSSTDTPMADPLGSFGWLPEDPYQNTAFLAWKPSPCTQSAITSSLPSLGWSRIDPGISTHPKAPDTTPFGSLGPMYSESGTPLVDYRGLHQSTGPTTPLLPSYKLASSDSSSLLPPEPEKSIDGTSCSQYPHRQDVKAEYTLPSRKRTSQTLDPAIDGTKRAKKCTSKDQAKTKNVRKNGACWNCRIAKKSCGERVCESCLNLVGGLKNAKLLCEKYDDEICKFRKQIFDFYDLNKRSCIPKYQYNLPSHTVVLAHPLQIVGKKILYYPDAPKLEVQYQQREGHIELEWFLSTAVQNLHRNIGESLFQSGCPSEGLRELSASLIHLLHLSSKRQQFILVPESLPSREELLRWSAFDLPTKHLAVPHDVEAALDAFLWAYAKEGNDLEHHDLVTEVLELVCLGRYFDNRRPVEHERQQTQLSHLNLFRTDSQVGPVPRSKTISIFEINQVKQHSQIVDSGRAEIFRKAANEAEKTELSVLKKIEDYMMNIRKRKMSKDTIDPIIVGLCIRRTGLYYRRNAKRYRQFGEAMEIRRGKHAKMYDQLSKCYAYVLMGKGAPYHEDWKAKFHSKILGNNENLLQLLTRVRDAERWHCIHDLDLDEDIAYLYLFAKRKGKRQSSLEEEWKRLRYPSNMEHPTSTEHSSSDYISWDFSDSQPPDIEGRGTASPQRTGSKGLAFPIRDVRIDMVLKGSSKSESNSKAGDFPNPPGDSASSTKEDSRPKDDKKQDGGVPYAKIALGVLLSQLMDIRQKNTVPKGVDFTTLIHAIIGLSIHVSREESMSGAYDSTAPATDGCPEENKEPGIEIEGNFRVM